MSSYTIQIYGTFNNIDIQSIVDHNGTHWFTRHIVAAALDIAPNQLTELVKEHSSEFTESFEYTYIEIDNRKQIVYSEEGFFTICDMAPTERAYRLRKWMRQQFRARQNGDELVIQQNIQQLPKDDLSGLGDDLIQMQMMLDAIAANRRRLITIEKQQSLLGEEQRVIKQNLEIQEHRISAVEERAIIQPGEMTAIQLATRVGWVSKSGAPHNVAVILAAINEDYDTKRLLVRRPAEGPAAYGRPTEVCVFTADGVVQFISNIDQRFSSGQSFIIEPNEHSKQQGYKNRTNVYKT